MGACAGGAWICATNWNGASASHCMNARLARYWQSSATAGSRCVRAIHRPTKRPRRRLKKLRRDGHGTASRPLTVFNVDQCENIPDSISTGKPIRVRNPDTRDELADAFLHSTGADIREGHGEAYYVPSRDFISMPAFAGFKGADQFYNVRFHELTHWSGHKSRLDRDLKNRFGSRNYAAEELIAELGAAFLCAEFGFDGDLRSAGYIGNWIELLRADKRAFFTACSQASRAADYLRGLALAEPSEIAAGGPQLAAPISLARCSAVSPARSGRDEPDLSNGAHKRCRAGSPSRRHT